MSASLQELLCSSRDPPQTSRGARVIGPPHEALRDSCYWFPFLSEVQTENPPSGFRDPSKLSLLSFPAELIRKIAKYLENDAAYEAIHEPKEFGARLNVACFRRVSIRIFPQVTLRPTIIAVDGPKELETLSCAIIQYNDVMSKRLPPGDDDAERQTRRFLNIIGIRFGSPPGKPLDIAAWIQITPAQCQLFSKAVGLMGALREVDISCLPQIGGRNVALTRMLGWIPAENAPNIIKLRFSAGGSAGSTFEALARNEHPLHPSFLRVLRRFENVRVLDLYTPYLMFPGLFELYPVRKNENQNIRAFINVDPTRLPTLAMRNEVLNHIIQGNALGRINVKAMLPFVNFDQAEIDSLGLLEAILPKLRRIRLAQGMDPELNFPGGRMTFWRKRVDGSWTQRRHGAPISFVGSGRRTELYDHYDPVPVGPVLGERACLRRVDFSDSYERFEYSPLNVVSYKRIFASALFKGKVVTDKCTEFYDDPGRGLTPVTAMSTKVVHFRAYQLTPDHMARAAEEALLVGRQMRVRQYADGEGYYAEDY